MNVLVQSLIMGAGGYLMGAATVLILDWAEKRNRKNRS